ncbi:hypothetical protein BWQ96_00995 [Gracilariopsis chorda]|uniref:Uncharacterized protein n=1 Tax=Gracilariopsis chorda TaxID=448386 RepID=A0A2V3J422_9FLOR|nr:hypothetical protein BWQ96_00995 [Gracilariopsis chorda]|eukprot:PXF49206.1 hypothetical protein BWQ96_00995 [Gracilariopsis chorda]
MSEGDLTKVGAAAAAPSVLVAANGGAASPSRTRTPPGSPRDQLCANAASAHVSAAKPPILAKGTTPMAAEIADSSGINLLSLVASERKMEEMRTR